MIFSVGMESSQAALNAVENSRDKTEDELDESMLEEKMKLERGEKLLDTSTDDISHDGKRSCVDSLTTSLTLNITVCSNYIFAHPKIDSRATSVVGSSHAGKLSALVSASLETKFLKLPSQSQTPDAAEDLVDKLSQLGLIKDDIVYLDLLSNLVYLGTDQDGIPKNM